ncbi:conjugal transfer protein TraG N-terminal domain-containing protein [Nocardia shimofusensis]|uniref:conjugal transfer protein TraG N-terminal domain-containing protein n=1 Tax=Nocardia shimofusensis TaxID=228596 RepID=UPI001FDED7B0|nr:conjugal transfer protein TraG N-terminal domain-containing protein [Nocardia shimofusensis]
MVIIDKAAPRMDKAELRTESAEPRGANTMVRKLVTILAVIFTVMVATPTVAYGQTYGFDETCNEIHDTLDGVGLPGISLGDAASAVCKAGNAASHPGDAATAVKDKAWESTFGSVVDSLMNGLGEAIILALTFWMKVPNEAASDGGSLFTKINDYTYQIQILLLIASIILTGARLAEARRGAAVSEAAESFRMFARVVFSSWMLGAVIVAGTQASDRFAEWIIEDSTNGNAKDMAELMVKTSALQAFSPGLVLIIAIVGLLGALAQIVLAIVRQGLLIIAAGVLPLAAAASGMNVGKQSYQKLVGWIIAFMLWKPVAAIVYMIAFTTAGHVDGLSTSTMPDGEQAQRMLVAIVLLCSVAFVLPALMRLVTPAVAIVGSGGSGLTAAGGTLVAAAALGAMGTKAVGVKQAAAPGSAGYVSGSGSGPRPGGAGGPGGGRPGPNNPQGGGGPRASGAQGSRGVPSGAATAAGRVGAARAATSGMRRADDSMGDVAGDRWANRSPDLGRSTIPR